MDAGITVLLERWGQGDRSALDQLAPLVYPHLRELAAAYLRRERPGHTLQATGLVNEIFLKLIARREVRFSSRGHFFALSAKLMRMALIDHARNAKAKKRGADAVAIPLHDELPWVNAASDDVLDLDRALDELQQMDADQARMFELRFLMGCTAEETAELMGVSVATIDRKVRVARAWLYQRLRLSATKVPQREGIDEGTEGLPAVSSPTQPEENPSENLP
ncbi:MAG: sigma-70 family RNA polymerase sigma factor [Bryobacterales bacterium]|jgi:RNA polymerase sigma factor (TIGR02999 family)|nr:sigma-70 family RNA polymerase sigma factor [Bryobacterales bacterium]